MAMNGSLAMTLPIEHFSGEFRFLSNFEPVQVHYEGAVYPTVEHAYQAAKTLDLEARRPFQEPSPYRKASQAKREGGRKAKFKIRPDWNQVKFQIMEELLFDKFRQQPFRSRLLATGSTLLIEGNHWHDRVWGQCYCNTCLNQGLNMLGKLLMKVRGVLHAESSNTSFPSAQE